MKKALNYYKEAVEQSKGEELTRRSALSQLLRGVESIRQRQKMSSICVRTIILDFLTTRKL